MQKKTPEFFQQVIILYNALFITDNCKLSHLLNVLNWRVVNIYGNKKF